MAVLVVFAACSASSPTPEVSTATQPVLDSATNQEVDSAAAELDALAKELESLDELDSLEQDLALLDDLELG